jgi:hypothetical protein
LGRLRRAVDTWLPWLALTVGFSPVLFDLAGNLIDHPESRFTLLAPVLLVLALWRDPARRTERHWVGALAIAFGIALELLGILTDAWSIARFGLPVAALGLAFWLGAPRLTAIALVFFAIPPPDFVVLVASPTLELALARFTSTLLRGLGLPVEAYGFSLVAEVGRIELRPLECGVALAFTLAALGWYAAAIADLRIGSVPLRAIRAGLLAIPLELLVTLITGVLLGMGARNAGQFWLTHGAWIAASLVGLAWIHGRAANRPGPSSVRAEG